MKKTIAAYIAFIFLAVLTSCSNTLNASNPADIQCIDTLNEFLYEFSSNDETGRTIYPLDPWVSVSEIPYSVGYLEELFVAGIRKVNGLDELWIGVNEVPIYYEDTLLNRFFVYKPDANKWFEIDTSIDGHDMFVDEIFISSDGVVFGRNVFLKNKQLSNIPVISKYNDEMGLFEPIEETRGTSHGSYSSWPIWDEVYLSTNDVFWIFSIDDAIYSFDLGNYQLKKHLSLDEYGQISNIYPSPDGSLLFNSPATGGTGKTIRFNTEDIVFMVIDQIKWNFIGVSLVDSNGNIWLNSGYGYIQNDGSKVIFHPNPTKFKWRVDFNSAWRYYHFPNPFFESSDGRIWFRDSVKIQDDNYGSAWFDPHRNEGCWFTTESSNITEDFDNNLWMMSYRSIYKLDISK